MDLTSADGLIAVAVSPIAAVILLFIFFRIYRRIYPIRDDDDDDANADLEPRRRHVSAKDKMATQVHPYKAEGEEEEEHSPSETAEPSAGLPALFKGPLKSRTMLNVIQDPQPAPQGTSAQRDPQTGVSDPAVPLRPSHEEPQNPGGDPTTSRRSSKDIVENPLHSSQMLAAWRASQPSAASTGLLSLPQDGKSPWQDHPQQQAQEQAPQSMARKALQTLLGSLYSGTADPGGRPTGPLDSQEDGDLERAGVRQVAEMEPGSGADGTRSEYIHCPLCNLRMPSVQAMNEHMDAKHDYRAPGTPSDPYHPQPRASRNLSVPSSPQKKRPAAVRGDPSIRHGEWIHDVSTPVPPSEASRPR